MKVEIGQTYEVKGSGEIFKVLCIDGGECFVKWNDGGHGVLKTSRILSGCVLVDTPGNERNE